MVIAVDIDIDIEVNIDIETDIEVNIAVDIKPRCSTLAHLPAREHALHEHEGNRVEAGPINRVAVWSMRRNYTTTWLILWTASSALSLYLPLSGENACGGIALQFTMLDEHLQRACACIALFMPLALGAQPFG